MQYKTFDWEREAVHDDQRVRVHLALEQAHHLDVAAATRMHRHLQQGQRRDLHVLNVKSETSSF